MYSALSDQTEILATTAQQLQQLQIDVLRLNVGRGDAAAHGGHPDTWLISMYGTPVEAVPY
jgi:hypothetical protein